MQFMSVIWDFTDNINDLTQFSALKRLSVKLVTVTDFVTLTKVQFERCVVVMEKDWT